MKTPAGWEIQDITARMTLSRSGGIIHGHPSKNVRASNVKGGQLPAEHYRIASKNSES
jgi:hypothetical protein